jgi:hypothetical protein
MERVSGESIVELESVSREQKRRSRDLVTCHA